MATGSLLALLDDIALMLDDVAAMTKVAAKKTAGVLGDDLALNAQQISGVATERELPVIWQVAKGSAINKLILVPASLAISYFIPWAITPLMMLGGAYLCFEGFEKLVSKFLKPRNKEQPIKTIENTLNENKVDLVALERDKIKGAVRTDFILSAEIIVITLGTVTGQAFSKQVSVVTAIAIIMTVGIYGLVAGIIKMDDLGLYMMLRKGKSAIKQIIRKLGQGLINITPYFMRLLSFLGTAAMFLVGGGIISHSIPALLNMIQPLNKISALLPVFAEGLIGLLVGAFCVALFELSKKFMPIKSA